MHAHAALRDASERSVIFAKTVDDGAVGETSPPSSANDRVRERVADLAEPAAPDQRSIQGHFSIMIRIRIIAGAGVV